MKFRNRNPRMVRIINYRQPLFACKNCGMQWSPNIKPDSGGEFYKHAWECPNGCKPEALFSQN